MPHRGVEIQKLKIALTSGCCLACRHCGVDKALGARVSLPAARAAVRALLVSPGKGKRLELYGGEPFMEFGLMKSIVRYARARARAGGKAFSVSVASNGLLLDRERLEFLRDNAINLSVSFSGLAATHNFTRVFGDGRGSFSAVAARLPLLFSVLDPRDVVALDCVHPANAARAAADFKALARRGFRVINVECVHGPAWPSAALEAFKTNLAEICAFVEEKIAAGVFIYPEPLLELARASAAPDSSLNCPFYRDLELYPDGSYAFYPFAFIDYARDIDKVRIGKAARGFYGRYASCRAGSAACRGCVSSYYRLPGLSDGSFAYRAREAAFRRLFAGVLKRARKAGPYRDYAAGVFALLERNYAAGGELA